MTDEAYPEAAEVLRAAGWAPHNGWGVYTRGTLVMGHPSEGEFRLKDWAAIRPGHPQYSADTPDTAVEAALWLVAKERKSGHDTRHETDSMALPKNGVTDPGLLREIRDMGADAAIERAGVPVPSANQTDEPDAAKELAHETDSEIVPEEQASRAADLRGVTAAEPEPIVSGDGGDTAAELSRPLADDAEPFADAAFDEIAAGGADLDPLLLPEPEPEDFAPDEIPPADEVAEAVAIFGDNLPMQRLLLIGRVTQIAGEMKAVLQEGWTVDEFRELQNHIMRMSQGIAPEDEHARARFAAISEASRAMSAIDAHAERQVEWINGASRDEIASYKPEEGWP